MGSGDSRSERVFANAAEKAAHEKAKRGLQRKEAEALAARQRANARVEVAHCILVLPCELVIF